MGSVQGVIHIVMKVQEILQLHKNDPRYIKHWLVNNRNWVTDPDLIEVSQDGKVTVHGNVHVKNIDYAKKLPIQFAKVDGDFTIGATASEITTFEGFPSIIGGNLRFTGGSKIKSLHNIHKQIKHIGGGIFEIYSVDDSVLGLLMIRGLQRVLFQPPLVSNIINKYIEGDRDIALCQDELIDARLEQYARL